MIAILLKWHQTISWTLGHGHGTEGRPYCRPWWVNEALYALAYTYAKRFEIPTVGEAARLTRIDHYGEFKDAL
jgi:hypothetical protein